MWLRALWRRVRDRMARDIAEARRRMFNDEDPL